MSRLDRREFLAGGSDPGRSVSDEAAEDVELIPYGCTNIRVTEFPRLRGKRD